MAQALGIFGGLTNTQSDFFLKNAHYLINCGMPAIFLWGPSLYLYVRTVISPQYPSKKIIIHFIPSIIFFLLFLIGFYSKSLDEKEFILLNRTLYPPDIGHLQIYILHVQIGAYVFGSLHYLQKFKKYLLNNYSAISDYNLSWLRSFLYFYTFSWIVSFLQIPLSLIGIEQNLSFHVGVMVLFLFFYSYIFYKSLFNPELFNIDINPPKYKGSLLNEEEKEIIKDKLLLHMRNNRPYIKPNFKLDDLASEIEIPKWRLSQVINESLNCTFFDFINQFRVEESKQLLLKENEDKTVLEILYSVGFNSKAAFNRAFKKIVGLTPTQYKLENSPKKG